MGKKKHRVLSTKVKVRDYCGYPLRRCLSCEMKWRGVIRNPKTGEIEKVVSCVDTCFFTKSLRDKEV